MKTLFLMTITLMVASASYAQRSIRFEVSLVSPADGSSIETGKFFTQQIVIKNLGPDTIKPADTIGYIDPATSTGSYIRCTGYAKAPGDTIQINDSIRFNEGAPLGNIDYCVGAFARNKSDTIIFDTSGKTHIDCNTVTLVAPSTGIVEQDKVSEELLAIGPNPARTVITFDFISKGNSEITARVYDISGRTVLSHKYTKSFAGQQGFTLDIATLNSGMYFVEFRQEGYKAAGKLTKQ